jgi:hypothetical protein
MVMRMSLATSAISKSGSTKLQAELIVIVLKCIREDLMALHPIFGGQSASARRDATDGNSLDGE